MHTTDIVDSYGRIYSDRSLEEIFPALLLQKERLQILDLSGWDLTGLPTQILQLQDLQALYLDRNGLVSLPDWIGELQQLRILSLGRNQLSALPSSLLRLSMSLEKLFLGHNQISELPFPEYEMMALQHGSIGRNPIRSPISRRWMLWDDFVQFPNRIQQLLPPGIPPEFEQLFSEQALQIIIDCQEPMVYELFLEGVRSTAEGIQWSDYFKRPCFQRIGEQLLHHIPRGTIVDDSLLPFVYS